MSDYKSFSYISALYPRYSLRSALYIPAQLLVCSRLMTFFFLCVLISWQKQCFKRWRILFISCILLYLSEFQLVDVLVCLATEFCRHKILTFSYRVKLESQLNWSLFPKRNPGSCSLWKPLVLFFFFPLQYWAVFLIM